jgi:membrane-anchored protein YejM (alkaline phosphatase superfamily)
MGILLGVSASSSSFAADMDVKRTLGGAILLAFRTLASCSFCCFAAILQFASFVVSAPNLPTCLRDLRTFEGIRGS